LTRRAAPPYDKNKRRLPLTKKDKKRPERERPAPSTSERGTGETDDIDFPTVVWSLAILAVLVLLHRLIWGG